MQENDLGRLCIGKIILEVSWRISKEAGKKVGKAKVNLKSSWEVLLE